MKLYRNIYACLGHQGWNVLLLLYNHSMTFTAILRNTGSCKGTISETMRCLKANDLVYRKRSPITFQLQDYTLTARGKELVKKMQEVELECQE